MNMDYVLLTVQGNDVKLDLLIWVSITSVDTKLDGTDYNG